MPQAPSAPVPQRGGGGGFVSGVLGGMFGAAAGSWMYDSFRRTGNPSSFGRTDTPPVPPSAPYRSSAPPPADSPSKVSGGDGYNTGGDFDSSAAAVPVGAGGDFDSSTPAQASVGAGGDFDSSAAAGPVGAGGDFDSSTPAQASTGAGGDFDSPSPTLAEAGAGGDFDSRDTQTIANDNAGGDFGSPSLAQADAGSSDGGFDVPSDNGQASSGGDLDSVASSSGDTAGNTSGGDFGDTAS